MAGNQIERAVTIVSSKGRSDSRKILQDRKVILLQIISLHMIWIPNFGNRNDVIGYVANIGLQTCVRVRF